MAFCSFMSQSAGVKKASLFKPRSKERGETLSRTFMTLQQLIQRIKQKKELQDINDDFVKEQLLAYFKQNPRHRAILTAKLNPKSALTIKIIKSIRAQLRRVYGLFRSSDDPALDLSLIKKVAASASSERKKIIAAILQSHASTKERVSFYTELYRKIIAVTGKPTVILDLGCGLNPLSIPWMNLKRVAYHAYDLHEQEVIFLNSFFQVMKINGRAVVADISRSSVVSALPKADLCFVFKMTDIFDQGRGHKASEMVIRSVPARFVVVSFPTVTMSGKKMNFPRRKWIELLSRRLGYSYSVLEFSNEIFYVITKG
ncbi:MAG: hypothetical protein Q8R37_05710 [Nanoarchaeota archaeon]|nr:hypothetical protein [Nanoarchaeota archaeon]